MRFTPLSTTDRHHFETRGYLVIRGALDERTVASLIAAGDRLIASPERRGRQCGDEGRYDGFRNCIARDPAFLPVVANERTLPTVVQLLSSNLQLHTSHLIYKAPDPAGADPRRRSPGWHRDINTSPMDLGHAALPRLEIKVAYQLSDASTPGHGQTLVAPGSHRHREELPRPDGIDPSDVVEPLLAPGDAMLFENRTWHAGGANRSGRMRKTLMMGYSYRWMRPDDYFQPQEELFDRCDPITLQLLGGTGGLLAADGSFRPEGTGRPLVDWARVHGVLPGWQEAAKLGLLGEPVPC